jgi:glycosyltransferase involved in cell wall biosynthesis
MRIQVLNHNLRGEATWHRAWNVALQLRRHGHEVTLFTVHPTRRLTPVRRVEGGLTVIETPFLFSRRAAASGLDPWDILWRTQAVLSGRWEVLYAFSSLPNVALPLLLARGVWPQRTCLSDWDDLFCDGGIYEYLNRGWTRPLYRVERRLERRTRQVADGVTVTSQYLLDLAQTLRPGRPVAYLPSGSNPADIPVLDARAARLELGLPPDRIILTYLGGGFNEDGLVMLDALALARREMPNLHLLQVSERDARYLARIAAHGLGEAVTMTGRIPFARVPLHLAAADILLMPLCDSPNSRARGPIKLRDYLCAGRPIVGTALGEVEYWLSRYPAGRLAGLGPEPFAQAIVSLARDPEAMLRLGREARRVAEQELSWDVLGRRVHELILEWRG